MEFTTTVDVDASGSGAFVHQAQSFVCYCIMPEQGIPLVDHPKSQLPLQINYQSVVCWHLELFTCVTHCAFGEEITRPFGAFRRKLLGYELRHV